MSRRKDMERFLNRRQQNADYVGFRGVQSVATPIPVALESAVCSVCQRKRNVEVDTLPEDRSTFVCMSCHQAA
ncbi:MAG: hypothetical protein BZY75_04910 [SAR202 cluster bacterium Io17-Chloro-G7]|nr:MAG: hypothetical protein BZY75_04910 [SAR202 cluster bacterium Io17-Chloro-G7]